jgi:YebC/PmpR family DNA-binding regulatory protein
MSGHSKWSTIKHKKAAKDAKRGKLFSKLIKEITVAAKIGGGDINANPRLRTAVTTAKSNSVPNDNIDRAIKKGTGEIEGVQYEEIQYEGYGPGGAAVLVQAMTDNRNRTVSELRHLFSRFGGNMGEAGCVAWMFQKRGVITVEKSAVDEEKLMEIALEAGAADISEQDDVFEVTTDPEAFNAVKEALDAAGIETGTAEVTMVPSNVVDLSGASAERTLKLLDELEDHDDVQDVACNVDIDPEELERLAAE